MQKIIHLTIAALLFITIETPLSAVEKELRNTLNNKELKKIEAAEKLFSKGDAIIKDTEQLEKEVEKLKNADGRIRTGKINKLNKQIAEKKVNASVYYKGGYDKYIKVLDDKLKVLEKEGNSVAKQTRNDIKVLEKKARKQYKKAENITSAENMIDLIEKARENQNKAIELQSTCLLSYIEGEKEELSSALTVKPVNNKDTSLVIVEPETPEENSRVELSEPTTPVIEPNTITTTSVAATGSSAITPPMPEDTIIKNIKEEADTIIAVKEKTEPVIKVEEEHIEEKPEIIKNPDIYLTIQFLSNRSKATQEQIKSIYSGNKEIIEKSINGLYKYSVGKYISIVNAKADMQNENIKGYIVAYNKDQRITVKEAISLISGS